MKIATILGVLSAAAAAAAVVLGAPSRGGDFKATDALGPAAPASAVEQAAAHDRAGG